MQSNARWVIKCKFPQKTFSSPSKLVIENARGQKRELKSAWPFDCLSINERYSARSNLLLDLSFMLRTYNREIISNEIGRLFFPWTLMNISLTYIAGRKKIWQKSCNWTESNKTPPTKPLLIRFLMLQYISCSNSFWIMKHTICAKKGPKNAAVAEKSSEEHFWLEFFKPHFGGRKICHIFCAA